MRNYSDKIDLIFIVSIILLTAGNTTAQDVCKEELGITLPPSINFATSPNPVGSGARAIGWGMSFIAVADDATAASWNPGGLIQLEKPEVSIVGAFDSRFEYQDVIEVEDQTFYIIHLNYFSLAYPFELFRRNMIVSLNSQRLFDLHGKTRAESWYINLNGKQHVDSKQKGELRTISPAFAVQISPRFSVGAALNFWTDLLYENGWEQEVVVRSEDGGVASGPVILSFESEGYIKEKYSFSGFNTTIGFLWDINGTFMLGGVVKTPFKAKVNHKHNSNLSVTIFDENDEPQICDPKPKQLDEDLYMKMPISYGLGLSIRFSDRFSTSFDVFRAEWSMFELEESRTEKEGILVDNVALTGKGKAVLSGGSKATHQAHAGLEYLFILPKTIIPVRAGVFYDPEPAKGNPDNFFGLSLGTGISLGQDLIIDCAYILRAGNATNPSLNTGVYQHKFLLSSIYHF